MFHGARLKFAQNSWCEIPKFYEGIYWMQKNKTKTLNKCFMGPGWISLKIPDGPSGIFAEIPKFYEGIHLMQTKQKNVKCFMGPSWNLLQNSWWSSWNGEYVSAIQRPFKLLTFWKSTPQMLQASHGAPCELENLSYERLCTTCKRRYPMRKTW